MLIEILVTIGILAVGLLGVSAMQITSLKSGQAALSRGDVALLMSSMTERMRANSAAFVTPVSAYQTAAVNIATAPVLITNPLNTANVASNDINQWINDVQNNLGAAANPTVAINCAQRAICQLTIAWDSGHGKTQLENDFNSGARVETYNTTVIF